jgi:hypothetical protein
MMLRAIRVRGGGVLCTGEGNVGLLSIFVRVVTMA